MSISVVIATYNRAALLDDCLTHLARQRFGPGDEVIVVDNGSTDRTASVIDRQKDALPVPLVHLFETRPGKSHALGRAVRSARGDVLAFTDDDVNVGPAWLDAIRTAMNDPAVALVGGAVDPRWEGTAPRWLCANGDGYGRLAAPLALVDYGATPSDLGARTAIGANLAVRRDVLEQVGGFAPHLGKLRGTLLSGEDHDFCRRVQAAGFRAIYWPDARVRHWVPRHRARWRYLVAWFFWSGITNAALDDDIDAGHEGVPPYLVRRFFLGLIGAPAALVIGDLTTALDRTMDAAFAAGYAAKRWGFITLEPRAEAAAAGGAA